MNAQHTDHTDAHREAQDALPWLANGTLAGTELERVQAHVHGCAACRADLAQLHTLRAAKPAQEPDWDVDGALARLLPQLDAPDSLPVQAATLPVQRNWRAWLAANDRSWLRVAVAMQCCAIAVLAGLLLRPGAPAADYRVLGASPGAQTGMLVMFKPDTPERELRRIVIDSGAHIVGGPTVTGAWMLGTDGAPAQVVARLRTEPAVTLAESLGAEGRP
jgi:hypothetical protein